MINRIFLLLVAAVCAFGQTDAGSIRVLVTDATGLAVADARVDLTNVATGVQVTRVSATDGYATFTPIAAV